MGVLADGMFFRQRGLGVTAQAQPFHPVVTGVRLARPHLGALAIVRTMTLGTAALVSIITVKRHIVFTVIHRALFFVTGFTQFGVLVIGNQNMGIRFGGMGLVTGLADDLALSSQLAAARGNAVGDVEFGRHDIHGVGTRGGGLEMVLGVAIRVAISAQLGFPIFNHEQLFIGGAMHTVTGLANHITLAAEFGAGLEQGFGVFLHGLVDRMVPFRGTGAVIQVTGQAEAGVDVFGAQKERGKFFLPVHPVGAVAGAAIDLAVIVKGKQLLAVLLWDLDMCRRLDAHRVKMLTLGPGKTGVAHKTVVAGKAHALGGYHVLFSRGDNGFGFVGDQGVHLILLKFIQPHHVADGTFTLG